ncbi:MAG: TIGR04282 family arsenosugar biosynthesis glycosyltransferase [Actinomycetota bacterium]
MQSIGLFARYPTPGRVKTRLAASVGNDEAAAVYKECAELSVAAAREAINVKRYVFCSDGDDISLMTEWIGPGFEYLAQDGIDLAGRLDSALAFMFSDGADKAIVASTDTPDLSADIINKALEALAAKDIVIGPARDGGYYLIGMKQRRPELFQNAVMGTDTVRREAEQRAAAHNLSVAVLGELHDIDTIADLEAWRKRGRDERVL